MILTKYIRNFQYLLEEDEVAFERWQEEIEDAIITLSTLKNRLDLR